MPRHGTPSLCKPQERAMDEGGPVRKRNRERGGEVLERRPPPPPPLRRTLIISHDRLRQRQGRDPEISRGLHPKNCPWWRLRTVPKLYCGSAPISPTVSPEPSRAGMVTQNMFPTILSHKVDWVQELMGGGV